MLVLAPEDGYFSTEEMIPSDSSLLGEKCIIFVMRRVVNVDECVGGHITVMSVEIVEYTGVE